MAKDKKSSKAAAPAPVASKPIESVKAGRVTKAAKEAKAVAKDTAKGAAKEVKKQAKKVKKAPTPSESSSDEEDTSASSASSESGSDSEVDTKKAAKTNGKAAVPAAKKAESASDSDESSASDSEEESAAPKKAGAAKINGAAKPAAKDDSSDDDSSSASDSDDDAAPKVNGKTAAAADDEDEDTSEGTSDSDSESDSGDEVDAQAGAKVSKDADDSSSASSSGDEDEEVEAPKAAAVEPLGKKRKAEAVEQTPNKKVMVDGEQKDACPNLFVGGLSWSVDEEWLTREFEEYGELKSVRVITDRDSGRSKGFGYVEFTETANAIAAIEAKNGQEIDGRAIRLDFSLPRQVRADGQTPQQRGSDRAQKYGDQRSAPSSTLFVGNVSFDADETAVTEMFQEYGSINAVRLPTDRETGALKGFGYVEMSTTEEATAALEALHGQQLAGRPIRLDYSTPKSNDSPRGGGFSGGRGGGRGGFNDRGGRGGGGRGGGRGGFGDRGRGRGDSRGGRGGTTNRGGFGDFSGKKMTF